MTLNRVVRGQSYKSVFVVDTVNAFIDAARANRIQGRDAFPGVNRDAVVLVKNETGAALGRFHAVGLGAPIILPSENETEFTGSITFRGLLPGSTTLDKFAIVQEPIAKNKIGVALIDGITPCRVAIESSGDGYATATDGDASILTSARVGAARILWVAGASGEQWALVQLGRPPETSVIAKTSEEITARDGNDVLGSGDAEVYDLDSQDTLTASGKTVEVWNFCNEAIEADSFILCRYLDGRLIVDTVCCDG